MESNQEMTCTDERLGKLLFGYESGQLNEREQRQFERHLFECEYCYQQIVAKMPIMGVYRDHKDQIYADLRKEGFGYDALKEKIAHIVRSSRHEKSIQRKIVEAVRNLGRPRIFVPITVVATALILFIIIPQKPQPGNPFVQYLTSEKMPYRPSQPRSTVASKAQEQFRAGMDAYIQDNFKLAARHLENAVIESPDQGHWWLYLGVSYYLDRQGEKAIEALTMADSLTRGSLNDATKWYLVQSFLLIEYPDEAIPVLESLIQTKRGYAQNAESLLSRIRKIEGRQKTER